MMLRNTPRKTGSSSISHTVFIFDSIHTLAADFRSIHFSRSPRLYHLFTRAPDGPADCTDCTDCTAVGESSGATQLPKDGRLKSYSQPSTSASCCRRIPTSVTGDRMTIAKHEAGQPRCPHPRQGAHPMRVEHRVTNFTTDWLLALFGLTPSHCVADQALCRLPSALAQIIEDRQIP